jgi:hypothetical protein
MLADFLIVAYNEMISVCMDGLSACLVSFLQHYQIGPTTALIQRLLLSNGTRGTIPRPFYAS